MVSSHPLISKSFFSCINLLLTVPSMPITVGIPFTFIFHSFFSSLARSRYLFFFPLSFSFTLLSAKIANPLFCKFSFFFFFLTNTRSGHLADIRWSVNILKIPENFVHLIFLDGFQSVHIPFVCWIKFKFLAQFSVDHLAHPVMSSLILSFIIIIIISLQL